LIDTHCHLYLEQFQDDRTEVLQRAVDAGVQDILLPAITLNSLPKMDQLHHSDLSLYKMAGIHPTSINEGTSTTKDELYDYCSRPEIIGVGETGLDYHWSEEYKTEQRKSLHIHCEVAKATGKPIVLHNRASTADLFKIIDEHQDGRLKGVWHCFNGSVDEGKQALDLGLHLGIGGIFTFKNAGVDESVAQLPIKKMMLETDAPYLAPEPKRGKRNEPSFVRFTAQRLAEVKKQELVDLVEQTSQTARRLFNLADPSEA